MSRVDKRMHQEALLSGALADEDVGVRWFVFDNLSRGYRPQFSPDHPVVVLKSKKGANPDAHPCVQWAALADAHFQTKRDANPLYVLDLTGLPPLAEKEEEASTILAGPQVKRSCNALVRLNPHHVTLVAAGPSATLAMKITLLGPRKVSSRGEPFVGRLVLVCPAGSAESFRDIIAAVSRRKEASSSTESKPELVILLDENVNEAPWRGLRDDSHTRQAFSSVQIRKRRPGQALFTEIVATWTDGDTSSEGADDESEGDSGYQSRLSRPVLSQIKFVLSRYTKQAEQEVEPSPIDGWAQNASATALSDGARDGANETHPTTPAAVASPVTVAKEKQARPSGQDDDDSGVLLCELPHLRAGKEPHVLEALVVDPIKRLVGTAHGVVTLNSSNQNELLSAVGAGDAIRCHVSVQRSLKGKTSLLVEGVVRPITAAEVQQSSSLPNCAADAGSWHPVSSISHSYGVLLIRGKKCVMVRSLSGEFRGMRLPYQLHADATQSAMECAIEAACFQCDISEDNFGIHTCIPPVTYYPAKQTCVTIFVAVANYASTDGSDDAPDTEELSDPYDWLTYESALQRLETKAERHALERLRESIQQAFAAGVYVPPHRLGVFGSAGEVAESTVRSRLEDATNNLAPVLNSSSVRELHVVDIVATAHHSAVSSSRIVKEHFSSAITESCDEEAFLFQCKGSLTTSTTASSANSATEVVLTAEGARLLQWLKESSLSTTASSTVTSLFVVTDRDLPHAATDFYDAWYSPHFAELCDEKGSDNHDGVKLTFVSDIIGCSEAVDSLKSAEGAAFRKKLVDSVQCAHAVLIKSECGHDDLCLHVVSQFVKAALAAGEKSTAESQSAVVPVLAAWGGGQDSYIVDADDDGTRLSDAADSRDEGAWLYQSEHFGVLRYARRLPFAPSKFSDIFDVAPGALLINQHRVLWVQGTCWLSTRFGYRGTIEMASDGSVAVSMGDPWWCLLAEADRPDGIDESEWDPRHGDRLQDMRFVVSMPVRSEEIMEALDRALCPAAAWRVWQREPDPLPAWS